MSPEDAALEDARHVVDVANAVMAAKNYDAVHCSCGLAVIAAVVAGDDPAARIALAKTMMELVRELEPDLVQAIWN